MVKTDGSSPRKVTSAPGRGSAKGKTFLWMSSSSSVFFFAVVLFQHFCFCIFVFLNFCFCMFLFFFVCFMCFTFSACLIFHFVFALILHVFASCFRIVFLLVFFACLFVHVFFAFFFWRRAFFVFWHVLFLHVLFLHFFMRLFLPCVFVHVFLHFVIFLDSIYSVFFVVSFFFDFFSCVSSTAVLSCMRCRERQDRWYVYENHTEWRICPALVQRLSRSVALTSASLARWRSCVGRGLLSSFPFPGHTVVSSFVIALSVVVSCATDLMASHSLAHVRSSPALCCTRTWYICQTW